MDVLLISDGARPQAKCSVGLHVGVEARGLTLARADSWLGVIKVCMLRWMHGVVEAVCVAHGVRNLLSAQGGSPGAFVSDLGRIQRGAGSELGLTSRGALLGLLFDVHFLPLLDWPTI